VRNAYGNGNRNYNDDADEYGDGNTDRFVHT